jgi:hypothetical protein
MIVAVMRTRMNVASPASPCSATAQAGKCSASVLACRPPMPVSHRVSRANPSSADPHSTPNAAHAYVMPPPARYRIHSPSPVSASTGWLKNMVTGYRVTFVGCRRIPPCASQPASRYRPAQAVPDQRARATKRTSLLRVTVFPPGPIVLTRQPRAPAPRTHQLAQRKTPTTRYLRSDVICYA